MVMFMRMQGLSIEQIGAFVAAVLLPWGLKFAWAPLIDIVQLRAFGGRKTWILVCTTMMIITLLTMAAIDFVENYAILVWMVILNNIFCATQDVAIDSLAVSTLKDDERGTGNGFMFGGQYLGIAMGGGGAIFVSGQFGFNAALVFVSALLVLTLLFVMLFIRDPLCDEPEVQRHGSALTHFLGVMGEFVRNLHVGFVQSGRGPALGIIFALLPTGAMALGYALLGTIQVDYGLNELQISKIAVANTLAAGSGCVLGGFLGDRFGIRRSMSACYVLTTVPTLYLAYLIATNGLTNIPVTTLYGIIVTHGLIFGAAFAQQAAVFMGMTSPAVAATQFTAYMALCNLAISFGNYWQGMVAERIGYATALTADALIMLIPLALIPFLSDRKPRAVASAAPA